MTEIKNAIDRQVIGESTQRLADIYYKAVTGKTRLRPALAEAYGAGAGAYLEAIGMRIGERIVELERRALATPPASIIIIREEQKQRAVIGELKRVLNLMGLDEPKDGM